MKLIQHWLDNLSYQDWTNGVGIEVDLLIRTQDISRFAARITDGV